MKFRSLPWAAAAALLTVGCSSIYYNTMDKMGVHKRDILVDRVEKARETQEETKEQFKSALERFTVVMNFKGGDLQEKYDKLSAEFERSEAKAQEVRNRIASVEDVAGALFKEWKAEIGQYTSETLRRDSRQKYDRTREQYDQLIVAMKKAEAKIKPVLDAFRDQVLFLKHNLNAQAIASLKGELASIETDVAALIQDMERSIAEADSFLKAMGKEQPG